MPAHHPKHREIPAASSLPPTQSEHRIGSMECSLPQHEMLADVRFGSKADICSAKRHVSFTPESGHPAVDRRGARVFAAIYCGSARSSSRSRFVPLVIQSQSVSMCLSLELYQSHSVSM